MTPLGHLSIAVVCAAGLSRPLPADAGDQARGEVLFQKCHACHSIRQENGALGPSLSGIFGKKAASQEQFRYSPAMRRSDVVWDDTSLDQFLAEPQTTIRGNRMPFAGMPEKSDRDDLIAYLRKATAE